MRKLRVCLLALVLAPLMVSPYGAGLAAEPLTEEQQATVARRVEVYLRYLFAWGPETGVQVTSLHESALPGLYSAIVEVSRGEQRGEEVVFVSGDGRYVLRGDFYDTTQDPFAEARQTMVLAGHPSKGPADAPVVIVEYGDFQCPTCAALYPTLKKILAERKDVRVVYKDLPLTRIHDWALPAALAGQCAFRQSPEAFWGLHDYFFENQKAINKDNLAARLDAVAPLLGLRLEDFRACRAQEATRATVENSLREAAALGLQHTPSLFINGRPLIEATSREAILRLLEYEARLHQQGSPPR
jgi:protein-disulfide isomerase